MRSFMACRFIMSILKAFEIKDLRKLSHTLKNCHISIENYKDVSIEINIIMKFVLMI